MSGPAVKKSIGREPGRQGDSRPHVLALVQSVTGGAERIAVEIAARLDPARFRSTICVTRLPEQLDDIESHIRASAERRLAEAGTRVIQLRRTRTFQLSAWRPLLAVLHRDPPAVIHGHMFGSNMWATVFGCLFRVPHIVVHDHGQAGPLRTRRVRLLTRHVLARTSAAAIAVSRDKAGKMVAQDGFDVRRVHVILNGVPGVDVADGRRIRDELAIGVRDPVVVSVTMLRRAKAVEVLIDAAAQLAPRFPRLRVLIAGDGSERTRLEGLIRERRIEHTVSMLGTRSDIPDILAAANVAALASDMEGMPLAVIEYMEARLPIVATCVGGIPELIDDGIHGLLIPPRDADALAAAIAGLLEDPTRARRLAAAAHERKCAMFDVAVLVQRIECLYEELLLNKSGARRKGR